MEWKPTLVIDNLSALFYDAPGKELIQLLQKFAKSMADKGLLSIVLAGSEGKLVDFLYQSSSSASRLHVYDIATDITFEEAVTYLKCMCPQTSAEVATDMVKLVGGRFVHLRVAAFELALYPTNIKYIKESH